MLGRTLTRITKVSGPGRMGLRWASTVELKDFASAATEEKEYLSSVHSVQNLGAAHSHIHSSIARDTVNTQLRFGTQWRASGLRPRNSQMSRTPGWAMSLQRFPKSRSVPAYPAPLEGAITNLETV